MKDQKLHQRLIIHRVNKDAVRSSTFKVLLENRKTRKNKSQVITELDAHVTDDDEEDDKEQVAFEETEDFKDDYLDREFDNTLENKKAKK